MSKQEQLSRILEGLRDAVPDVHGAIVASFDGLPVATSMGEIEPSRVAAVTATVRALGVRVVETMGAGGFQEIVIRSQSGVFVVYDAGEMAALAVVARSAANLGLVNLEARRVAADIAEVLASARREAEAEAETEAAGETVEAEVAQVYEAHHAPYEVVEEPAYAYAEPEPVHAVPTWTEPTYEAAQL